MSEEKHSLNTPNQLADEYEDTWLHMWNNSTNPKKISCRTAFDILFYCFSKFGK